MIGIGSTGFDGAKEGPLFNGVRPDLQDLLHLARGDAGRRGWSWPSWSACWSRSRSSARCGGSAPRACRRAGSGGLDRRQLSRRFAHTLIPIAAAYVVAHYFSLLAYNGQDLWRLASDPLGDGSDLFGGAGGSIDYSILSATAIWYAQVIALVGGHVAALVLAHDRALVVYGSPKAAARSQIVMLVLMVCFTCLGLWLLSAALTDS